MLEPVVDPTYCPVRHLFSYLEARGTSPGHLFLNAAGIPVKRDFLAKQIRSLAGLLGLDREKYNTQSLRIRRTTDMAEQGENEAAIIRTGRWNSSAYLGKVRCVSCVLPK